MKIPSIPTPIVLFSGSPDMFKLVACALDWMALGAPKFKVEKETQEKIEKLAQTISILKHGTIACNLTALQNSLVLVRIDGAKKDYSKMMHNVLGLVSTILGMVSAANAIGVIPIPDKLKNVIFYTKLGAQGLYCVGNLYYYISNKDNSGPNEKDNSGPNENDKLRVLEHVVSIVRIPFVFSESKLVKTIFETVGVFFSMRRCFASLY